MPFPGRYSCGGKGLCVHVWSGVKRNTTRNTILLPHMYTSQLRCFSFPPSAPVATVDSWEVRKSAKISGARESNRECKRVRERGRERERESERERERVRECKRVREREKEKERETERVTESVREQERERERV